MQDSIDLSRIFELAESAAREAGGLLFDNLHRQVEVSKKGRIDLVTEMDLAAESLIVDRIRSLFPDHSILAEEKEKSSGSNHSVKWVIDPLDGTTNYAHGYRLFCVSIGVEINGRIVVGVVFDPVKDECFSSIRGNGAFLNGGRLQVSARNDLVDCLVATGFSYQEDAIRKNLEFFSRFMLKTRGIRRDGCAALDLCYVAAGRFDGFWELSLNPWDIAAGALILEEAGGAVTRFNGQPYSIYHPEILATNRLIHSKMSAILSQ